MASLITWHWPDARTDWQGDRGLAYADGVFETLRILPAGPVLAAQHQARLLAGCQALGLTFGAGQWAQWWRELERRNWLSATTAAGHIIKIIVTRGTGGRGYRPPSIDAPRIISSLAPMPALPQEPVRLHLCQTPVAPTATACGYKTLNRLDQVLAAREIPAGCFEGLMTDSQGRPVEGTRSNIFVLSDDVLYTPPRRQLAVAGVLRDALVARLPAELGILVKERPLTFAQLRRSQGVFIANSVMGVLAVAQIGCFKLSYADRTAVIQSFTRQHFGI